jgi:3-hydroxyacyl-CoA dehydrogenase
MIIETVVEDAASKRTRFTQLAGVMPKDAILASCASAPGLEELYEATVEPGRVIGLGFFDPVNASPKVQVTIGSQTNRVAAERVLAFIAVLGKSPVMNGKARRAE